MKHVIVRKGVLKIPLSLFHTHILGHLLFEMSVIFSPSVLMHSRLVCVTFCLSHGASHWKKVTRGSKVRWTKVKRHRVKPSLNVMILASGLTSMSSCFIFISPSVRALWNLSCSEKVLSGTMIKNFD